MHMHRLFALVCAALLACAVHDSVHALPLQHIAPSHIGAVHVETRVVLLADLIEEMLSQSHDALNALNALRRPNSEDNALSAAQFAKHLRTRQHARLIEYSTFILTARDGTQLYTRAFIPTDTSTKYGTVIDRSPYGPSLSNDAFRFVDEGYAVITQDIRGTGKSDGYFDMWRQDSTDAYDTMSWITSQSWSNGQIFAMGVSADGCSAITQWLASPPWLSAQWVTWYTSNGHPTAYPGGAYRENLIDKWLVTICPRCIADVKNNEAFGPYWDPITSDGKFGLITGSSISSTGWYDIFTELTVAGFNGAQKDSAISVRGNNFLVATPGGHCSGTYHPNRKTSLPDAISYKLFDYVRKGNMTYEEIARQIKSDLGVKAITFYVMGPDTSTAVGNYWTSVAEWPSVQPVTFYFAQGGLLAPTAPTSASDSSTFSFDPANPIRTIGGNELFGSCGPEDQARLESRADLLLFTSDTLRDNIAITGAVTATLYVSSSAVDTDFTVKITDVHPDGRSLLIMDGIIRMRWRETNTSPVMMNPGETYKVDVFVGYTSYVFNAGHRIRVAVSSSNFPRFSVNPNNGYPINDASGPMVTARNTVFFDQSRPSHVTLPSVSLASIPLDPIAQSFSS